MRRPDVARVAPEEPSNLRLAPLFWPACLFVAGVALAYGGAVLEHRAARDRERGAVRTELEPIRGALSRELFGALHLTEGIASLIAVEGGIEAETFRALAEELFHRTDLIRNVVVAPGNVVQLVFPSSSNEATIGLDYSKHPEQWPSVERMMNERRMVVAGPVALVQGGTGVIGRTPVYVYDPEERVARYWGLTSTVLELERLLEKTPLFQADDRLDIALRGVDGLGERGKPFWGDSELFTRTPVLLEVPLPSGSWQLAAVPRGGWRPFQLLRSTYFQVGGSLSLLLSALLLRLLQVGEARRREVLQRRAAETALLGSNHALEAAMAALEKARDDLEARVEERTRELRAARDAAQSADRLKSAFLATMSHELRTPLNSIIGFSGILRQGLAGPLNDEQLKQLGMVSRSADHLLALINDVLDLSKIEAGQLPIVVKSFDLRASLERSVVAIRPQSDRKGLTLELEVSPEVGSIRSDPRRVEQVVLNLLSNAVKFTDVGSIRVQASGDENHVSVRVQDSGLGIEQDKLDRLFLPFSQIDNGLDRLHEGTGLGLSISKRLIDLLGGRIWVESTWGQGSTFGFELPRERA